MLESLKKAVYQANLDLVKHGLVVLTWGNVSAYDPQTKYVVIKPSGVAYEQLSPNDMVVVDLEGNVIEGKYRPSSDTPTHLLLYKAWGDQVRAIVHTHSINATAFAQAKRSIDCYGTTHADLFYGSIRLTRELSALEVDQAYELNTGRVILEAFANVSPLTSPGVLIPNHGPFAWGNSCTKALEAAITLETIAEMAWKTLIINPHSTIQKCVQEKHFQRKHGKNAYYGQTKKNKN